MQEGTVKRNRATSQAEFIIDGELEPIFQEGDPRAQTGIMTQKVLLFTQLVAFFACPMLMLTDDTTDEDADEDADKKNKKSEKPCGIREERLNYI